MKFWFAKNIVKVLFVYLQDNSEEMYSLDNDSFLNSLEAMTIQNYWTDSVKHTKLWQKKITHPGKRIETFSISDGEAYEQVSLLEQ